MYDRALYDKACLIIFHVFLLFADLVFELPQSVKKFGFSDQAKCFVRPDLFPFCLQNLSADDTCSQKLILT